MMIKKEEKDVVLNKTIKKLSKKYNKKEEVIKTMLEKCSELNYDISESVELILEYFKK